MKYKYRYSARVIIEAETPLCIRSGKVGLLTDAAVIRDSNGFPFIPGTAIAGVLRHGLAEATHDENKKLVNDIFGFQTVNDGHGSMLICSSAQMIGVEGKALDGTQDINNLWANDFYANFISLPVRQHVRITDKGVAAKGGKFDEEIVYKGTRFVFEIELLSNNQENINDWEQQIMPLLSTISFRIGGGTRKGFGKIGVHSIKKKSFDLSNPNELEAYLNKSASLADDFDGDDFSAKDCTTSADWILYNYVLEPADFVLFGSGYADDDADMTPVKEQIVEYNTNGIPTFKTNFIVAPASSIKGAIAHRTAFYYNKHNSIFADKVGVDKNVPNTAVEALFGSNRSNNITRGNVIFSDLFVAESQYTEKIFNHVAIDRFTGGAIQGALFQEKTAYLKGNELKLEILVNKKAFNGDNGPVIKTAFESALYDLCNGYLPLGGCSNHGHGIFIGHQKKEENHGTTN
jgi:CRISPR/Cas system CSM-associated protein Csm3 (group 7 of RAMP superfamily)